jgi:hypothetical protein
MSRRRSTSDSGTKDRGWCKLQEDSAPLSPPVSVHSGDSFRTVHTEWFVDVPSERAAPAVVIPSLPHRPVLRPPEAAEVSAVRVWVVPTAKGLRVLPANAARPVGAKLMRLVAEEQDPESLEILDTLRSR